MEKREHSCAIGGNVNLYRPYERQYGDSLKKQTNEQKSLGIQPPYDSAIPLKSIHPEETKIQQGACILLFIAAIFTIARTWKQPRCPLMDEWLKKLWYIYTLEYYIAIKRTHLSQF